MVGLTDLSITGHTPIVRTRAPTKGPGHAGNLSNGPVTYDALPAFLLLAPAYFHW